MDHTKEQGREGSTIAVAADSIKLAGKLKKGEAQDEGEARLFKKKGERKMGEIRFVKAHLGITGSEEADKTADWRRHHGSGKEKVEQEEDLVWSG